ncbi:MAG: WxcM-like domain-containing protein, partial [Christensenellaceae bacterium]
NTVEAQEYVLDNSCNALYIGPLVWREMYDFSENAVLLVLASEYYDENDYIREYDEFMIKAKELFS